MVVLGIDAAWTLSQPSGVALVKKANGFWKTLCVAPSYESFISLAAGIPVDWDRGCFSGTKPEMGKLMAAAEVIASTPVNVVAIDMPVATLPIYERREADNAVSREFGRYKCGTHSPNRSRPGAISANIARELSELGYPIATSETPVGTMYRTVEVYPHPALLTSERVRYKVAKSNRYWGPGSRGKRIGLLLRNFSMIEAALSKKLGDSGLSIPSPDAVPTLSHLKRYEDALDAIICVWVGVEYTKCRATPFGDETAAIWVPQPDC